MQVGVRVNLCVCHLTGRHGKEDVHQETTKDPGFPTEEI